MPGRPTTSPWVRRTSTRSGRGGLSKIAPNGKPLSPALRGFTGGGIAGPGFGLALDANDNVWVTSLQAQTISKLDTTGKPLSPPEGWNFNKIAGPVANKMFECGMIP